MNRIDIVGIGPGREEMMTGEALRALEQADVIIGYTVYLELLDGRFRDKELLSTPMRREEERCRLCFREAAKGKRVALICSGDAGIYGMASLMYEIGRDYPETELRVAAGVTAASSGAAVLGAPLGHDFCTVSLSDLLTPWEQIERRLRAAAAGDFVIVLYNPSSHKRKDHLRRACDLLLGAVEEERVCGYVENIGRAGTRAEICTLKELRDREVNMFTTVFIGSSRTELIDGKMVTKRGYHVDTDSVCAKGGTEMGKKWTDHSRKS
ncbi:MAG: precorrin-3B C(17)-methyltransferase [Muribaculum sp.]|nr:precorrin-3B C(17)-methyltransferase [Muribaculum sp.]